MPDILILKRVQMFESITINHDPSKTRVALLAGGTSGERPISLKSAEGAKGALQEAGYMVEQLDPAESEDLKKLVSGDYDVAFLCLHGKGGEDGSIQGFLETIDMPYTCSGIRASAISIDKAKTKVFYEHDGIPTARSVTVSRGDDIDAQGIISKLGNKVVVKAATEGSSIGVYIVEGAEALAEAIDEALAIDTKAVVEQYVQGREFTCVVIGDGPAAQALPVIEIIPKNASYDFESKYAPGGSKHVCPAELDEKTTRMVQDYAVRAHNSLGCEGVSRTDFIVNEKSDMWALETNTVPGMTSVSLLPDAARAAGVSFPELCKSMVQMALDRAVA